MIKKILDCNVLELKMDRVVHVKISSTVLFLYMCLYYFLSRLELWFDDYKMVQGTLPATKYHVQFRIFKCLWRDGHYLCGSAW